VALKASKIGLDEFLRSGVWADLKDILKERIAINQNELNREDLEEDVWIGIRRDTALKARLGELQYLLNLPRFLADQYEAISKMEEEGEEDAR